MYAPHCEKNLLVMRFNNSGAIVLHMRPPETTTCRELPSRLYLRPCCRSEGPKEVRCTEYDLDGQSQLKVWEKTGSNSDTAHTHR
jgi:hypothetical protein